jgi:DNA-directed RNA polymerase subunit alpha
MRVGERTDYNRLFLEVETDGTISPEEAFCQANEILVNHFSMFSETFKAAEPLTKEEKPVDKAQKQTKAGKKDEKTKKRKKIK